MSSLIVDELPRLIQAADLPIVRLLQLRPTLRINNTLSCSWQDFSRQSIFGHSMGGHGAITLYLLNPSKYRSASGLAPILNPTNSPWGQKAFSFLLAGGVEEGKKWDATELLRSGHAKGRKIDIFVDYVRMPFCPV
jgi:S-formylglutathione hydrolase FrmB